MNERIVPLAALGDPSRLAAVAEQAFGRGDRVDGWFARKLWREHVDPALSHVATGGDLHDPNAWLGYVLVGTPPSRAPAARTAGTAVLARARGRGLGSALLHAAAAACRAHGHTALELWAEHGREDFYARLGFASVRAFETLLAFARGEPGCVLPEPAAWDPSDAAMVELHGWLREAWERTPNDQRSSFGPDDDALVHVAREGRSFAIHRTLLAASGRDAMPEALACFERLLMRLPAPAPVVAIALDRVSSVTAALREHGWSVAQRGTVMSLAL